MCVNVAAVCVCVCIGGVEILLCTVINSDFSELLRKLIYLLIEHIDIKQVPAIRTPNILEGR